MRKQSRKRTRSNTPDPYKNAPPEKEKPKQEGGYGEFRFKVNCKFKNKKQKELFNSIMDNRITFVRGPAGTGKAQPLYCNILTPNGWKLMGDIKAGDKIITPENTVSEVIGVFPQGEKDIYKVTFSDGSYTFCCDEHLWSVKTSLSRDAKRNYEVLSLKQIKNNLITKNKKLNYSIPVVKEIEFDKKNLKIDPYLMGLMLGDGCFRIGITYSCSKDDSEIKNYIEQNVKKYNCRLGNFSEKGNTDYFRISGYHQENKILNSIKEYELLNTYSDTKFIPSDYLLSSIEDRKEILSGLLDSDGYIDKRCGSIYFYTTSSKLKDGVLELVNSLGGVAKVKTKIGKYKKEGIIKECKLCYIICISLNFNPFKLKRKFNLYKPKTKYIPIRYIKDIEYIGKDFAQCISIKDENHLYITDNYIVTHNTILALYAALETIKNPAFGINQIILTKPIVEITSNKGLGALPGDLDEKTNVYFSHFYDNLTKLIGPDAIRFLKEAGFIKEIVLNYIRGITLGRYDVNGDPIGAICILDEAQNTTVAEMKTFISRMGEGTKLVIMGDSEQIDLRLYDDEKCGLDDAIDRLYGIDMINLIEFNEDEIVRDPFLIEIMKRYKK